MTEIDYKQKYLKYKKKYLQLKAGNRVDTPGSIIINPFSIGYHAVSGVSKMVYGAATLNPKAIGVGILQSTSGSNGLCASYSKNECPGDEDHHCKWYPEAQIQDSSGKIIQGACLFKT